ncbi:MAG: hypothetical protein PHD54_04635 [Desulfuromonadaceae bacterium]|nr:hypothetical protein [Desulfuromonadaceae bacterium]
MLIEILKRTPSWVFLLFFVLLALGYFQSKDRVVGRSKITILPAAMIVLSFYGVISAFGLTPFAITSWLAGVVISVWLGLKTANMSGVSFMAKTNSFSVPGSWLPLSLMMAIFFTKYTVGVILARKLPIANELAFIGFISLNYGLLSGAFYARAIAILRTARVCK